MYYKSRFRHVRKMVKAIISYVKSVCPHGRTRLPLDFNEILYFRFFESVEKIQFSLNYDKYKRHFTGSPMHVFVPISLSYFRMRNASDKCCSENENTCFIYRNIAS